MNSQAEYICTIPNSFIKKAIGVPLCHSDWLHQNFKPIRVFQTDTAKIKAGNFLFLKNIFLLQD